MQNSDALTIKGLLQNVNKKGWQKAPTFKGVLFLKRKINVRGRALPLPLVQYLTK